mgnify:FL=1
MKGARPTFTFYVLFVVLVVGTVVSYVLGDVLIGLIVSLSAIMVFVLFQLVQFYLWTRNPIKPPRMVSGLFQVSASRLFRSSQNTRKRSRKIIDATRGLKRRLRELPEAWLVTTSDGQIMDANDAARNVLDLPIRTAGINLIDHWQDPRVEAIIRSPVTGEVLEVTSPKDNRSQLEVRLHTLDRDQRIILVRDVTPLNRLLTTRQDFLANISHELRSPLTVIVGYLEALQDSATIQDTEEIVTRLLSPVQRMRNLVEDLLTLTRLESSPRPSIYDLDNVNVAKIIVTISNEIKELEGFDHDVEMSIDERTRALGIPEEIYSAINNLITNAIRYTPVGGKIKIRWLTDGDVCLFEVTDTGPGIATEHLQHLTERFYRVDSPRIAKSGGTGLGLAIVKHILLRHESTLRINSTLGEGSTFGFTLPSSKNTI